MLNTFILVNVLTSESYILLSVRVSRVIYYYQYVYRKLHINISTSIIFPATSPNGEYYTHEGIVFL